MTGSSPPTPPKRGGALPLVLLVGVSLAAWMIIGDLLLHVAFPIKVDDWAEYMIAHTTLVLIASVMTGLLVQARTKRIIAAEHAAVQAQSEAHQRDTEMTMVFEALPDLYFRLAADGTILDYRAGQKSDLYGPASQLLGKKNQEILPPEVGSLYEHAINRAIETGSSETIEYELIINQAKKFFESRIKPIDANQVIAIVQNITERKKAKQWIETTNAAMNQAPDSVFLIYESSQFAYVNRIACEWLQYSRDELESMRVSDIDPEYPVSRWPETWQATKSGSPLVFETTHERKDGSRFPVEIKLSYLRIDETELLCAFVRDITERRRAERVLAETRERFDAAVAGSSVGFWDSTDVTEDSEWWSPQIYEMLGYKPGEVEPSYERWKSWLHAQDRDAALEEVQVCFNDRKPYDIEYRLKTKSGQYRWFRARGRVSFDESGKPCRMSGSITDIHDSKLAQSEIRFRAQIIDQIHDSAIATDLDGYVTFWNNGAERQFGVEAQHALGKHISIIYPEEEHQFLQESIIKPLKVKGEHDSIVRLRRANGQIFTAHLALSLLHDDAGREIGMIGYTMDISDRKKAEEDLRESERRLRNLVEGTNIILWEVLLETMDFTYVNSHAERILGYPENSWYQPGFWIDHMHPDDRTWAPEYCIKETLEKKDHSFEYRMIAADGSVKWFRDLVSVVIEDGKPVSLRGALIDITERKRAEDEVLKSNQALQLLLSELDHRVKNSMSSLLALIDLTRQDTPTVNAFAESIRRRVETMASTHGLLSDSHWSSIDLGTIIRSLVPSDARGRVMIDGPALPVSSRQVTAMGMVIQELFTNSLKHGSLSIDSGDVEISWTSADFGTGLKVKLSWTESGGPAISGEPEERLGTQLIRGFAQTELGGHAHLRYAPAGARHELTLKLDAVGYDQTASQADNANGVRDRGGIGTEATP